MIRYILFIILFCSNLSAGNFEILKSSRIITYSYLIYVSSLNVSNFTALNTFFNIVKNGSSEFKVNIIQNSSSTVNDDVISCNETIENNRQSTRYMMIVDNSLNTNGAISTLISGGKMRLISYTVEERYRDLKLGADNLIKYYDVYVDNYRFDVVNKDWFLGNVRDGERK